MNIFSKGKNIKTRISPTKDIRKGDVMAKKIEKLRYEEAQLELIRLDSADVITTSTTMGDGEDFDDKAWT